MVYKLERKRSWKGSTAAKWTSTQEYRDNYDRIFGTCKGADCPHYNALQAMHLHLDALTTASNVHRLAQLKTLCTLRDCSTCEKNAAKVREFINGLHAG